jgi:hypothetical protein
MIGCCPARFFALWKESRQTFPGRMSRAIFTITISMGQKCHERRHGNDRTKVQCGECTFIFIMNVANKNKKQQNESEAS